MNEFVTDKELEDLKDCNHQLRALRMQSNDLDNIKRGIMENVFLRFLQKGRWSVLVNGSSSLRIRPADHDSEELMVRLVTATFNLDWHDSFEIWSGGVVNISGRVDDRELRLYLDLYNGLESPDVQEGLKILRINFDFGPMIRNAYETKISALDESIRNMETQRENLRNQLDKLRS